MNPKKPAPVRVSDVAAALTNSAARFQAIVPPLSFEPWLRLQESAGQIAEQFGRVLRWFEASERQLTTYAPQVQELGRRGWTLPMLFPATSIPSLAAAVDAGEDFDDFFREYYSAEDSEHTTDLLENLRSEEALTPWAALLDECYESFQAARFRVLVPALFVVLEAVLATAADARKRKFKAARDLARKRGADRLGIDALAWASLHGFAEAVYHSHSFAAGPPPRVNRHWVLHGRDADAERDRLDALRLLQALHTAAALLPNRRRATTA